MNKKNKAKRYLAGLLTVLMIFQQSGMNSILADSDEVPVTFAAEEELAGYDEVQEYEGQAQAEETVEEPVTEEVMEEEPITARRIRRTGRAITARRIRRTGGAITARRIRRTGGAITA